MLKRSEVSELSYGKSQKNLALKKNRRIIWFLRKKKKNESRDTASLKKITVPLCVYALLAKFWRISLYVTDDALAKLFVT